MKKPIKTFTKALSRVVDKLLEKKDILAFTLEENSHYRYSLKVEGLDITLKICYCFEGGKSKPFQIIWGKPSVIQIKYRTSFSEKDEVRLYKMILLKIKKYQKNNDRFKSILDIMMEKKIIKKYDTFLLYNLNLVYRIEFVELVNVLAIIPNLDGRSKEHKTIRYNKPRNGFHYFSEISFSAKEKMEDFLKKQIQVFYSGFYLEKKFEDRFKKREKMGSIFFQFEKTTRDQESKAYGDFLFIFLNSLKIYVDLKSSNSGVKKFISQRKGIGKKRGIPVIPLNYNRCLTRQVPISIIESYLHYLAQNPCVVNGINGEEFVTFEAKMLQI